jgi:phosphate-selective porin OprO and OprP
VSPTACPRPVGKQRFAVRCLSLLCLAMCILDASSLCRAQAQAPPLDVQRIQERLDWQDAEIARLRSILESQSSATPAGIATGVNSQPPTGPELAVPTPAIPPSINASYTEHATGKAGASAQGKEKSTAETPADGWLDVSGEKWTVKLGGHVQGDWIHWAQAEPQIPAQDYFEFRRLRLLADGTGYGVFDFRIQMDIEPENGDGVNTPVVDIKDAYLTMHELPLAKQFRLGNFFVPFSLEQVTNDTNNIFMERSIPTQGIFAADREVGMALYGINETQDVTWTVGAFMDSISESLKERIDDNQGSRVSGRLTWLPYYDEPSNGRYLVHTGVGLLYTDDYDGLVRFAARPQIHEGPRLIDSGNLAASSFTSGNVELATVWGPLSIQSEMFISSVDLDVGDPATLYGMYVYGSYFLTGENRIYERFGQHGAQFARNVPISNFFLVPGCCGTGAWEAKVRWSNLTLTQVDAGQYNDLTVGFNWYWTDRIRMMFDWIHPMTTAQTPFGATESDIIATRFDFNF